MEEKDDWLAGKKSKKKSKKQKKMLAKKKRDLMQKLKATSKYQIFIKYDLLLI